LSQREFLVVNRKSSLKVLRYYTSIQKNPAGLAGAPTLVDNDTERGRRWKHLPISLMLEVVE
jgi:hypothetical protein